MKTISLYVLVTTALLASSFRVGYDFTKLDKVAIVAIEGSVRSDPARDQIADIFAMELLRKGYAPLGRAQVKTLLREREFQSADLTTVEGAVEAGLIVGVPVVLVVDIPHFGKETSMTAKMISVQDGSIIWMGRGSAKGKGILSYISGFFRSEETDTDAGIGGQEDEVFAGIAGDVLGSPTGGVLSPKEVKKTQGIIETMCKSMPSRPAGGL
jgi:hypothetical protein